MSELPSSFQDPDDVVANQFMNMQEHVVELETERDRLQARVDELGQQLRDGRGSMSFLLGHVKRWPEQIAEIDNALKGPVAE